MEFSPSIFGILVNFCILDRCNEELQPGLVDYKNRIFNLLILLRDQTKKMDSLVLRLGALLVHALVNIVIISYLTNFDISGSWIGVIGFVIGVFILLMLFIKHLISFVNFLKNKTK